MAFHFNAPDRLRYACRLLRKAYLKGARVVVLASPNELPALDVALWTMAAGEFVPHCREGDAPRVRVASPILLAVGEVPASAFEADVLVNLTEHMPNGYERYAKVIEVVELEEANRQQARERWRQYRLSGHEPLQHDVAAAAG